jgi:hypothetical protein
MQQICHALDALHADPALLAGPAKGDKLDQLHHRPGGTITINLDTL